jgi:shikimate 5-dehydrogenase
VVKKCYMQYLGWEINMNYHYGLIGGNISASLSPAIHTFVAKKLGIENFSYSLYQHENIEQIKYFLQKSWCQLAAGFNITSPFKAAIAALVHSPLPAVNTLVRGADFWEGRSSDGEGLACALAHLGTDLADYREIVMLGMGGAVISLLDYFADSKVLGLQSLRILSRGREEEKKRIEGRYGALLPLQWGNFGPETLGAILAGKGNDTLLIQGTSAPQQGDDLRALVPALADYNGSVVDLIYGSPSALYHAARANGLAVQDGLPMLIEQARVAQRWWWGATVPYAEIRQQLAREYGV